MPCVPVANKVFALHKSSISCLVIDRATASALAIKIPATMITPMKNNLFVLALLGGAAALPSSNQYENQKRQDGSAASAAVEAGIRQAVGSIVDTTPKIEALNTPEKPQTGPPKEVTDGATKIGTSSYWWIDGSCSFATTPDNEYKSDFIKQAYKDATAIAKNAADWPDKYKDASNLYVGDGFDKSKYADEAKKNLAAAAAWDSDNSLPFQNWIRVSCDDIDNACGGKIGKDPRKVAAYANNTVGQFGWTYSRITMCDPFFTVNSVEKIKGFFKNTKKEDLQMIFMESSGEKFLHEALHLLQITEKRVHYVDQTFDGGRRIYGAEDVAKAARITKVDGFDKNYKNADTIAVFAQAAYWQEEFGVAPPPTVSSVTDVPKGATKIDFITDWENNYVEYVPGGNGDTGVVADCSKGGDMKLDGAKRILKQWQGKGDEKITLAPNLTSIIAGLDDESQAQVNLVGPEAGGSVSFKDAATALQAIIDKPDCTEGGNTLKGSAPVPNAKGFSIETLEGRF